MEENYYITPAGYKRFLKRMKAVAERYDAIIATNEEAADAGDTSVWHDNFAYEQNQRDMHQWAQRFHSLEQIKQNITVVDIDPDPKKIKIGCQVLVYDSSDDKEKDYSIVGYEDGDPENNRISYTSPLAQALLGARVGDLRKFRRGEITRELEVLEIVALKEEQI